MLNREGDYKDALARQQRDRVVVFNQPLVLEEIEEDEYFPVEDALGFSRQR